MIPSEAFQRIEQLLTDIKTHLVAHHDDVMDVNGVQELTGLSQSAIYHKTASMKEAAPQLPHYKQGKRLYFLRSEIILWMTQNKISSQTELRNRATNRDSSWRRKG